SSLSSLVSIETFRSDYRRFAPARPTNPPSLSWSWRPRMYPLEKGKFSPQAHVGVPAGTYEEEHGRKGFYGKSAHLYHAHPPTGWIRFEGKLRPHLFDLNQLAPTDFQDPEGMPVAFLGNHDITLYVSRRSQPM